MTNTRALFTGVGMGALIACIALAPHARAIGTDCSTLPCLGDPPRRPARPGLMLGFGGFPPDQLRAAVDEFVKLLRTATANRR